MIRRLVVLCAAVLASGCGPSYPTPFTAAEMSKRGTGEALVHYLAQPGATAAVCDRRSAGPRFRGGRSRDFAVLVDGIADGRVRPELWQRCAMLMLASMPPAESTRLLEEMIRGYRKVLSRGSVETDDGEKSKAEALHRSLLGRPAEANPREAAVAGHVAALRTALEKDRLGPVAARYGREALQSIDLEHGAWNGGKLTTATLDELERKKDETLLRRISMRAPEPELQKEAKRRIVRLHLAAATSPYVKQHLREIEELVVATGRNHIDVTKNPPTSAWLDEKRARVRGVLVRQDVWKQTATLLAFEGERPGPSVLPSVRLRGALYARIDGLAEPITLCGPAVDLDVTPCLLPSDLRPKVPVVFVDDEGLLHFVERLAADDARKLVYNTPNLPLPFAIAGKELLTVEWPIVFERPEDVVFTGPPSGRGPDLRVTIERRYGQRLLFQASAAGKNVSGVVEASDLGSFLIASRGGAGTAGSPGSPGAAGASGSAGSPGMCPGSPGGMGGPGGRGGNGTNGGPGGPGGPGGDVSATLSCVTGDCAAIAKLAAKVVRSEGGPGGSGGPGGAGGPGGQGGSGGSGASCTDSQGHFRSVSGGSPGPRGADGSPGMRGANGAPGAPGNVKIRVVE